MKNSKGISVIALVITVVVIIIITSVTVFTGVTMVSDARKKSAEDKLATICNSLRKDDEYMSLVNGEITLTQSDFDNMDLGNYYDEEYPIVLKKTTTTTAEETVRSYILNMYKRGDMENVYATQSFMVVDSFEKTVYRMSFDENKGVNRPMLSERMYAITSNGTAIVDDVYSSSWYDYKSKSASFAKMIYDTNGDGRVNDETDTYVWIPRFAYSIQSFYNGINSPSRAYSNVPSSAIKIVFLREDTNYMSNNEVLPSGYRVHPAFSVNGKELAGIWVAQNSSSSTTSFADENGAIYRTYSLVSEDSYASSHLMTNSEFSAALYLMYSLDDIGEINFDSDEFVAAGYSNNSTLKNIEYIDLYAPDIDTESGIAIKTGDAIAETNWDRTIANYPTSSTPLIVRLLDSGSGYFDFTSVSLSNSNYYYRPVIINN